MALLRRPASWVPLGAALLLAGCAATGAGRGVRSERGEVGMASYYDAGFHGHSTASGGSYDARALTAAHRSLPFGTRVRVTNLGNGRSLVLTVTDRGPFAHGRIIDVSSRAARELGFWRAGTARVRVEVLRS